MKNILKITLAIILSVSFFACNEDDNINKKDGLEITKIDLSNAKINFDLKDIDVKFNNKANKESELKETIDDLNKKINLRIEKDITTKSITYTVKLNDKGYTITDWILNETAKGGPYEGWDCPGSMTLIDTCWSESCIGNAVASALSEFSSGDTVNVTFHHGGALGGVQICV